MQKEMQLRDGSKMLLRPYEIDDVELLYEAACESVEELNPWMPWAHPEYSIDESRTWITSQLEARKEGSAFAFTMIDRQSGKLLGGCGLNSFHETANLANLGYWVRSGQTGRGLATSAALLVAEHGFKEHALNRIEIVVAIGNTASMRVAEKTGAKREGVLRNRLITGEKVHDAVMFSLIPEDFS